MKKVPLTDIGLVLLLLGITIVFFLNLLDFNKSEFGDLITTFHPRAVMLKESMVKYHDFMPLWDPYRFSGEPFMAKTHLGAFYFLGPLLLVLPNELAALKINTLINIFLSGLFMYLFVRHLTKDSYASFISALIYMLNGYFLTAVIKWGWVGYGNSYALIPLLSLLLVKATKENWLIYSVLSGVVLGLMIWGEHGINFLYSTLMIGIFLIVHSFGSSFLLRARKMIIIGLIIAIVSFGFAAFKILPMLEQQQHSIRSGFGWATASSRVKNIGTFFTDHIEPFSPKPGQEIFKVGIIATCLAIFAIFSKHWNKNVMFLWLVLLLSFMLITGTYILYILWKFYPGWQSMRYADRAAVLLVFTIAALAGVGISEIVTRLRHKLAQHMDKAIYAIISSLIIINLFAFGPDIWQKQQDINLALENNYAKHNLSAIPGIFRVSEAETRGIDFGTEFYNVPLGLENIFGYDTIWSREYLNGYLNNAAYDFPKFWGILNHKYMSSSQNRTYNGFKYLKTVKVCDTCFNDVPEWNKSYGPHLYENTKFLPRAYIVNHRILVVGEYDALMTSMFNVMISPNFNPSTTAIVAGQPSIAMYSLGELQKYDIIVLSSGAVTPDSGPNLMSYAQSGGLIFPDVTKGVSEATSEDLEPLLRNLMTPHEKVPDENIITHNFDRKEIKLNGKKGMLVVSEKYAMFPGWRAKVDGQSARILRVDGVITAVELDDYSQSVVFEYKPASFVIGSIITIITIIALIVFFGKLYLIRKTTSS